MKVKNSRHRKSDIKFLGRGYPETLQIFRMPASKYWYVGMYLPSRGRFVKQSTRCELLTDAKEFAKDWYEDRVVERRTRRDFEETSFRAYSDKLQITQRREIVRGELSEEMLYNDKLKLDNDLLPRLGHVHVRRIDYNLIDSTCSRNS